MEELPTPPLAAPMPPPPPNLFAPPGEPVGRQLYGAGIGVLCGVAMLIPFVWIVVLLVLSSKASKQLRAGGIKVGIFGIDPSSI
jgi:hypothetical protein